MRPASINMFDRYFLGALVLALLNLPLAYQDSLDILKANPATAAAGYGSGFIITVMVFSLGIPFLLWFLIARRASNIAKWILVVMTGLGMLMMIPSLPILLQRGGLSNAITLILTALQLFAISFLFRADAKAWLASRGRNWPTDPNIFS
jgi:hypothetical protein